MSLHLLLEKTVMPCQCMKQCFLHRDDLSQGKEKWPVFLADVGGLLEELRSHAQLLSRLSDQQKSDTRSWAEEHSHGRVFPL